MFKLLANIIVVLIILVSLSCKRHKLLREYKMYAYESKAYVDSINFPLFKLYDDNIIEIIKGKEKFDGKIVYKGDKKIIKLINGNELTIEFNGKNNDVIIYSLVDINVEAKYGSFKLVH